MLDKLVYWLYAGCQFIIQYPKTLLTRTKPVKDDSFTQILDV